MKRSAHCRAFYTAPVETVWRLITSGTDVTVDPLNEEQYNNTEPEPGTIFTRAFEVVQNKRFVFEMKSINLYEHWTIELEDWGVAETKITVRNDVTYRNIHTFLLSFPFASPRHECKAFLSDLSAKVKNRTPITAEE
ncbi:MAG: hypothetical protein LUC20_07000 [Oscillospiraceae bacterium]|nr:hypothetical protein [Oscillospiraceae bacterium]